MSFRSGFRPALRIARRDALRHRGRSLLVVALIALPVMALVTADVLIRSSTGSAAEQAALTLGNPALGAADAWLAAPAGAQRAEQYSPVDGYFSFLNTNSDVNSDAAVSTGDGVDASQRPLRSESDVLALLPAGAELTPWLPVGVPAQGADGHFFPASAEMVDLRSPVATGRFRVLVGTTATRRHEVALTTALADRIGARIGSVVRIGAPAADFTVVGLLESLVPASKPGPRSVAVTMPGQLNYLSSEIPRYLMRGASLDWAQVKALNGKGLGVYSRAAIVDPNGFSPTADADNRTLQIGAVVLGGLMAVMQVVFLAGPAFAVGARRMRRQLGQLGAVGASPSQIRAVVLAGGVVLGVAGALLGVAAGVVLGLGSNGFFVEKLGMPYVATHLRPTDLLVIFGLGVLTALLAALFPAFSASRTNLVAALGQTPGAKSAARWWSIAGALTCLAGIGLTLAIAVTRVSEADRAQGSTSRPLVIGAGLLLVEVGLVMATPLILQLLARAGAALPTIPRLAVRDAARHRGRSAPAVAAVMTVTAVAVAVTSLLATLQTSQDYGYRPALPVGSLTVQLDVLSPQPIQLAAVSREVTAVWPRAQLALLNQAGSSVDADHTVDAAIPVPNQCPWVVSNANFAAVASDESPRPAPGPSDLAAAATDWRCAGADYSNVTDQQAGTHSFSAYGIALGVVVGGPDVRRLVTGIEDSQADQVLRAGGTVLLDRRYAAAGGILQLRESHYEQATQTSVVDRTISLPASVGRWSATSAVAVMSDAAAARVGLAQVHRGLIVNPAQAVQQKEIDAVTEDLAAGGLPTYANLETGRYPFGPQPSPWLILGLAALLIALTIAVVTALSVSDARQDLSTLGAVGAPGWMRRRFSGWSALLVTAIGCGLGAVLGLLPSFGLARLVYQSGGFAKPFFEVPWGPIATVVVALPLLAFVVAAAVTRSRINLVARVS